MNQTASSTSRFFFALLVPGGTAQLPLAIPADNKLKGVKLDFQAMIFNVTTTTFGMTNGTEWFLRK